MWPDSQRALGQDTDRPDETEAADYSVEAGDPRAAPLVLDLDLDAATSTQAEPVAQRD
jgi:hypothetical protein